MKKYLQVCLVLLVNSALAQSVEILPGDTSSGYIVINSSAENPGLTMFKSGTTNADKMILSHSANHPLWGLQYSDLLDKFIFTSTLGSALTINPLSWYRNSKPGSYFRCS